MFQGPVPVTLVTLQELKDPETLPNPWVSFAFNESVDTGFIMERNVTPRSKYLLIRVGDRWLLADMPIAFTRNQVVGYLNKWWSPLSKQVIDEVRGQFPDHNIFPYQLDAEYAYKRECFMLLGITAFIFLVGLGIIGVALSDMHKIKRLALDFP